MKRRVLHPLVVLGLVIPLMIGGISWAAFTSKQIQTLSASVSLVAPPLLTITVSTAPVKTPVALNVFSGKDFVIPVQVLSQGGPIRTANLQIDMVYELFDASNPPNPLTAPAVVVVQFLQIDPNNPSRITGTAYIPRTNLGPIQLGGQLKYFFRVLQGAAGVYLSSGTAGTAAYPTNQSLALLVNAGYTANFVSTFDAPVSPGGSAAFAPDTFETDGLTGLVLGPHAVTTAGTLRIENLNVARLPAGPNGSKAVVAYNFSLIGTSLQQSAQLVLSYPADLNGQISGNGGDPLSLAPYWWDGVSWRVLGRPQIDTTLHTVTTNLPPPASGSIGKAVVAPAQTNGTQLGVGEQFEGSFALFPAGAATSASLRPAERIITPNGDGINDVATFSGLVDGDVVHIFDVRGRRVRTINAVTSSATQWDGRDDGGAIVESGVYIYQYTSQGARVSGVIAVAK